MLSPNERRRLFRMVEEQPYLKRSSKGPAPVYQSMRDAPDVGGSHLAVTADSGIRVLIELFRK
jgi:hypothetical protein